MGGFNFNNSGVLEYWSVGVVVKGLMALLSILQHSIAPGPKLTRTLGNQKITFLLVISPLFPERLTEYRT
jgi:hypothetical protein